MRLPRRGILIRMLIYGPLLGYFGWQALERWRAEQGVTSEPSISEPSIDDKLAPHKKWVTFPDGTKQEIYELTPEEAADILGHEVENGSGADRADREKVNEPAGDADADDEPAAD